MRSFGFFALLLTALVGTLVAQTEKYDPYAAIKEEPPIREDGTLNWPAFFKNAGKEARFNGYFAGGSCVGTNMRIVNMLKDNKVDVNTLPVVDVSLRAVAVKAGMVSALDEAGQTVLLLTHPKGVSKVNVSGSMTAANLRPGMIVHCSAGEANVRGMHSLTSLLVISPGHDVGTDGGRPIQGEIVRRDLHSVTIRRNKDRKPEALEITLKSELLVDGRSVDLIFPGDLIHAKGPEYQGPGSAAQRTIFAAELTTTNSGSSR